MLNIRAASSAALAAPLMATVALARLDGMDSLLSIAQMPRGVPVATVAVNGATNAGLLAARILSLGDDALERVLDEYRQELATQAGQQDHDLPRS